tara:strand:+ start:2027 stop:2230 length:204 start_codon:yes stop_codon:yes gene_type:complete
VGGMLCPPYPTSKVNMIFGLTNSFKANYIIKKEKTQIQNVPESCLVERTEKMLNQIISKLDKFSMLK